MRRPLQSSFLAIAFFGAVSCRSERDSSGNGEDPDSIPVRYADRDELVITDLKGFAGQGPDTGTLFQTVEATPAGMDFVHRWELNAQTVRLFDRIEAGGGVTVGDVDSDGLPDVFLTAPQGGSRLYRNLGDFRFEDITERAGLSTDALEMRTGASFADIDNDGDLDLAVCGFDCPTRLYVNDGKGTFVDQATALGFNFKGSGIMVSFSDYDRDGDLDAFIATHRYAVDLDNPNYDNGRFAVSQMQRGSDGKMGMPPWLDELWGTVDRPGKGPFIIRAGQRGRLLRNDGGQFAEVGLKAGIDDRGMSLSATWWDHNGDGWPDLYLANDFLGSDRLYENQKDGTFRDVAPEVLPQVPWYSMGSDVGDINNDGREDFIATDMAGSTHYKAKLAMGDMSKFAWFLESGTPRQYMRNAIYLNTGRGRKMEVAQQLGLDASDWTWSPKFGDLDCDGWLDIFITNGMTADWFNSDSRRQSSLGSSTPYTELEAKRDFNMALQNRKGGMSFEPVGEKWGLAEANASFGAALADLDLDGDLDIIVNRFKEPVALYRNRSMKERIRVKLFGRASNSKGVGATVTVKAGDMRQMRTLTLARGVVSTNEALAQFGLGELNKIDELIVNWPSGHIQSFTNLESGKTYEITEPIGLPAKKTAPEATPDSFFIKDQSLPDIAHQELEFDDFGTQPLLPNRMSRLGPGLAVGDIDGDGDEDAYLGGALGSDGVIIENNGENWKADTRISGGSDHEDMGALFFDAEGDGDLDLYVVSGGVESEKGSSNYRDRLYLNDGKGKFGLSDGGALPVVMESGSCVVAADYDGDGDLDLFVGGRVIPGEYPMAPPSHLLRNDSKEGRVQFVDVTSEAAPALQNLGMVTSALWSDVDGDGDSDLLVTAEWGPVRWFRNTDGKFTENEDSGISSLSGWWNGIVGGDLDHDGDIDYVVSNFGLNTKYHPSTKKPAILYYGDFSGNGERRIVEAKATIKGTLPVRGFSCSSSAIPSVLEKMGSKKPFHNFAIKALDEIYTEARLEKAQRFEVNELRSGALINDGEGKFTFRALPALAQTAPGFGMSLGDINGDAHLDLYMVQNFFSPQPETGRMHGAMSILMTGKGDGMFDSVWPETSGLIVPGDAKGLVQFSKGRFLISQNNGETLLFRPNYDRSQQCHIRLIGQSKNRRAIGARISCSLEGVLLGSFEVYGGSGYLSSGTSIISIPHEGEGMIEVKVEWPDGSKSNHQIPAKEGGEIRKP